MGTHVCTQKKPEKIAKWFKDELFEEGECDDIDEVIQSILTGDPDMELINKWLFENRDLYIEKWD